MMGEALERVEEIEDGFIITLSYSNVEASIISLVPSGPAALVLVPVLVLVLVLHHQESPLHKSLQHP